jgi:hypothetical protein
MRSLKEGKTYDQNIEQKIKKTRVKKKKKK